MNDYRNTYRSVANSHYLSEGIRITAGLTLPAIVFSYLGFQSIGITISLGASCVIMVDNPGPIHHRRNAMIVCDIAIFLVTLLTGLASVSTVATGLLIAGICFGFSMLGVYGTRAGSIGLAALFVMVLNLDHGYTGWQIFLNAVYVLAGGVWYTLLSLALYGFRPYRLAQQALGDCLESTADYLRIRAKFYGTGADREAVYRELFAAQVAVHDRQQLVRELLFKSRNIVKESTNTGRVLVLIFLDLIDLFERVMSSHQDYEALHRWFDGSGILREYHAVIERIADELGETGIAVKSGRRYITGNSVAAAMAKLRARFEQLRQTDRNPDNVEGFIALRTILESLEEIQDRLATIQQYTSYDLKHGKGRDRGLDLDRFVTHQDISFRLVAENFNFRSNTFRHALRVTVATTAGFLVSKFFPFGHSYWIMLTIIVILKPAYSITKKRNYDRLLGTIAGAAIGIAILYFVHNRDVIFGCMIVLMIAAYSLMRTRYLLFVTFMTPYILILFFLLNQQHFSAVITDRLIDTAIGSAIAFLANLFISPAWEHEQFNDYLGTMLAANRDYFLSIAYVFVGEPAQIQPYKLHRKQAYVALANITDALNRMLAEPKSRQRNPVRAHQLVVLNHMMASHIATLASLAFDEPQVYTEADYKPLIEYIADRCDRAARIAEGATLPAENIDRAALRRPAERLKRLLDNRRHELEQGILESEVRRALSASKPVTDQFQFIRKIAEDLEKGVASAGGVS